MFFKKDDELPMPVHLSGGAVTFTTSLIRIVVNIVTFALYVDCWSCCCVRHNAIRCVENNVTSKLRHMSQFIDIDNAFL